MSFSRYLGLSPNLTSFVAPSTDAVQQSLLRRLNERINKLVTFHQPVRFPTSRVESRPLVDLKIYRVPSENDWPTVDACPTFLYITTSDVNDYGRNGKKHNEHAHRSLL